MNERIHELLQKINALTQHATVSLLEKDLLLQYTRELYEQFAALETTAEQTADAAFVKDAPAGNVAPEEHSQQEPEADEHQGQDAIPDEAPDEPEAATESPEEQAEPQAQQTGNPDEISDEQIPVPETVIPEQEIPPVPAEQTASVAVENTTAKSENDDALTQDELTFTSNEQPFREPDTFELEPELQAERPLLSGRLGDFKLWNRDIRSYIGINDKYNFISELFGNNSEAYEEILNELNRCGSFQDGISFLNNSGVTTLYRWKEDGFSEQIFYNVLSQFFSAR
ncbi:hypothetical protein [Rurimicrobium arvi]|uniref:Uncharacterized protein n=1 Tax=Rurimicrobium arvi TaxID=2049916 RepID=A0ABP8MN99_9BACT